MLTEKDYCDYDTCVALKELGYNQSSIAFYPCQDIIVDCVDSNGELYEAEYDKGNLTLYSSLNNKNHDINKVQAPLLYEAQKWLREEKGIGITIFHNYYCDTREMYYQVELYNTKHHLKTFGEFSDWTQALSEGIRKTVKILKDE